MCKKRLILGADYNYVKKILILTYHYPPLNVIASIRAQAYAQNLHRHGWAPTVVTFDWQERTGEISTIEAPKVEEHEHYKVIRLGKGKPQNQYIGKFYTAVNYNTGVFDVTEELLACREMIDTFVRNILHQETFDLVLGIYSPHFHLEQCHWIYSKYDIPYVLDFRDLWDIRLTSPVYSPTFKERIRDFYIGTYWRKWARNAFFLSTVSEPYAEYLEQLCMQTAVTITNGFEADLFKGLKIIERDVFVIAHVGSFYPEQRVDTLFAVGKILKERIDKFEIRFIGVKNEEMKSRIGALTAEYELNEVVKIMPRITRGEALQETLDADVLYYPAWETNTGVYSGKIFEYLASGNPILVAPRDNGVVDQLIEDTQAGASFSDDPAMISDWVMSIFHGEYYVDPKQHEIKIYTRESQVAHFARLVDEALEKRE